MKHVYHVIQGEHHLMTRNVILVIQVMIIIPSKIILLNVIKKIIIYRDTTLMKVYPHL